jgi:uncharacterized protein (TIGR00730 family)
MNISIFGGSQPRPGDAVYQEAILLGQLLAESGHTVLTGGYMGIMEAVSRGAAEKGGHVIGVTCKEIENWRNVSANQWVQEEWKLPTLRERLWSLLEHCDLGIAMPGGAGTMAEISVLWNHQIIGILPAHPIILVGEGWKEIFTNFFSTLGNYTTEQDRTHLLFSPDVKDAVDKVNFFFKSMN